MNENTFVGGLTINTIVCRNCGTRNEYVDNSLNYINNKPKTCKLCGASLTMDFYGTMFDDL